MAPVPLRWTRTVKYAPFVPTRALNVTNRPDVISQSDKLSIRNVAGNLPDRALLSFIGFMAPFSA